jgi:hypothetical protein
MVGPIACGTRWTKFLASFERHHDAIIAGHPHAEEEIGLVHTALIEIVQLVRTSSRPPLWSCGQSSWLRNGDVLFPVRYELNLYMLFRGQ